MDSTLEKQEKGSKLTLQFKNPITAEVIRIAWPVLLELLLSSLFGMIDMMMLGNMKDTSLATASVAAVGLTNQPLFIGVNLIQALNVGGTAMVARYLGSKQDDRIETTLRHVVIMSVALAIPLSILGIIYTDSILKFMGAEADALAAGRNYFKIVMVGFIFQSITLSISAALRGIGETKIPMKINLKCNLLNVFGNAVLIYGLLGVPALNATGAALSTAFSQMMASILLLRYVLKGESVVRINLKKRFRFDKNIIYNMIKIGVPASLEQMALRVGIIMFVKIVAGLGTVAYATHQIALNILSLSFQPGQAFGIAASSLVGRSLGANELSLSEEYAKKTRKIGSLVSTFMAVIFFFFGEQIVWLYSKDPAVIKNASTVLKIIALVQPFQSSQLILAGALRGAGDTVWPLVATFVGVLGIRVILAYIFINICGFGLVGAWVATFIDQFVRWVFVYARFRTGHWKYVKIR